MPSSSKAKNNGDEKHLVCVTGAGSFIGSWVVKELLDRGYHVRGTARDPADRKNAHLLALEGAEERLTLCRADVLDYDGLRAAFQGCRGVFHVASPVSNRPEDMPAAVQRTRNAINAAADVGVRRVVFTASYGAVYMDPNRSPDTVVDETCWSDYDFCKRTGNLYCCAKMQETVNYSTDHVARFLTGAKPAYQNAVTAYTDVRDVARAHALVYEHHDNRGGRRYLCVSVVLHRAQFVQLLRDLFPHYPVTAKYEDEGSGKPMVKPYRFSNRRLMDLGMEFTPMRQSLYDTVVSLQQKGHLPLPAPMPKSARL
ncbi:unnamed protein product [Alopecurus aequalis]